MDRLSICTEEQVFIFGVSDFDNIMDMYISTYQNLYGEERSRHFSIKTGALNFIRKMVSQNRRRTNNLDLSLITPRIIAMGYPSQGETVTEVVRNDMNAVLQFLKQRYRRFKTYNLKGGTIYDGLMFPDGVVYYEMEDHEPPIFEYMIHFISDVDRYLTVTRDGAIAVHCKAGKGRTGVMICVYLIHAGLYPNPRQVLDFYGITRTVNNKGLTIPSQRRYVYYFAHLKENQRTYQKHLVQLVGIYFERLPKNLERYLGYELIIALEAGGYEIKKTVSSFSSAQIVADNEAWSTQNDPVTVDKSGIQVGVQRWKTLKMLTFMRCYGWTVSDNDPVFLEGDICVKLEKALHTGRRRAGEIWFNTQFCCDSASGARFLPGDRKYAYPNGNSYLTHAVCNERCIGEDVVMPRGKAWIEAIDWFDEKNKVLVENHYKNLIAAAHRSGYLEDEYNLRRSELFARSDIRNNAEITSDRPTPNDFRNPSVLRLRDNENVQVYERCEIDYAEKKDTLPKRFRVFIVTKCVNDERYREDYIANKESYACYHAENYIKDLRRKQAQKREIIYNGVRDINFTYDSKQILAFDSLQEDVDPPGMGQRCPAPVNLQ
uniref:phosphatidylinositol-3,4,5-trisphosphate 3-phosphatase n=1 Tax=Steinernema glaseri TaxID=37863 RepID=A0A1I7Y8U4_9BILA